MKSFQICGYITLSIMFLALAACSKVNFQPTGGLVAGNNQVSNTDTGGGSFPPPGPGMTRCDDGDDNDDDNDDTPKMKGQYCQGGGHGQGGGGDDGSGDVDDPGKCSDGSDDGDGKQGLCYLADGPGKSQRIGDHLLVSKIKVLGVSTAIPHDACMSPHACLDLINAYLNKTNGNFGGIPGPLPAQLKKYTSFKDKSGSLCKHNPNVGHVSDSDVDADISNLEK